MSRTTRLITAVMVVAIVLRVWGLMFGLPLGSARPDETQIAGPAVGYLSGDLRPPFFQWPPLFQYVVAAAYVVYAIVARPFTGFASIAAFAESRRQSLKAFFLISRSLSLAFGVWTVWLVYRIGRRLFDEAVGVTAALFLAVSFLHVRDSHFGVSDVPMTALLVAAVLLILEWQERGGIGLAIVSGVVTGLAGATKYNALGVAVTFAAAWLMRLFDSRRDEARSPWASIGELAAYTLTVAVAFLGTSPFIVIDWSRFLHDMQEVSDTLSNGPAGLKVGQGWWYFSRVVLPSALGWPMFALSVAGIVGLLVSSWRRAVVLLVFPIGYFIVVGRGYGVFARHSLPLLPFLCITAAWATVRLARSVARTADLVRRQLIVGGATLAVAAWPAWSSVQLDRLLATPDNRVVVARAMIDIIPPGSTFHQTGEEYGFIPIGIDGRPLSVRQVRFDKQAGAFDPGAPEWVLVQRSPLTYYSAVPAALEEILARDYALQRGFPSGAGNGEGRTYDQQDAFYLPLAGFRGISRPGPSFELYRRTIK